MKQAVAGPFVVVDVTVTVTEIVVGPVGVTVEVEVTPVVLRTVVVDSTPEVAEPVDVPGSPDVPVAVPVPDPAPEDAASEHEEVTTINVLLLDGLVIVVVAVWTEPSLVTITSVVLVSELRALVVV